MQINNFQGYNFNASPRVHSREDSCQINLRESSWTQENCQKFHTNWMGESPKTLVNSTQENPNGLS